MTHLARLIEKLNAAGVTLHITEGRLRYTSAPGRYTDELRKLVSIRKGELVEYLLALDGAAASVARMVTGKTFTPARQRVVDVLLGLAKRWHQSRDQRLLEVGDLIGDLFARWKDKG